MASEVPGGRLVIGIGNGLRGDDAAGIAIVRRLHAPARVLEQSGEATTLVEALRGTAAAYIVDAASGAEPGRVHRLDAAAGPLPGRLFGASTHGFGVAEGIELARALGILPQLCVVYAVEGGRFELGAPMSAAVLEAIPRVAARLARELASGARRVRARI